MAEPDYETLVSDTLQHWQDAIYWGVLEEHVMPAVRIYAHASLSGLTDPPDISGCFPLVPEETSLFHHYGNSIFTRLSSACTSIRSALQAIQARTDGHAAIAISRRAHEALWQTFWLANPDVDPGERVRRLLVLTGVDIRETIRLFSYTENALVNGNLNEHLQNINGVTSGIDYRSRLGRDEYTTYYGHRSNYPPADVLPPELGESDGPGFLWQLMSSMTHPNMVFDLITQIQPGFQDLMNRLQIETVNNAVGCVCNISTSLLEQAQLPKETVDTVNRAFRQPVYALTHLREMQREPNEQA